MTLQRNSRRRFQGVVASAAMQKTVGVRVERTFKHGKYGKYLRRHTKYLVHDEEGHARVGDKVEIEACRPMSRHKRFRLVRILESAVTEGVES